MLQQGPSDSIRQLHNLAVASLCFITFIVSGPLARGQDACQWPCFHGPDRTNKSTETGLLREWPEAGPPLAWSVSGLGEGYSTVSVADGLLFTAGLTGRQTHVYAYDLQGTLVWKQPNGPSWETDLSYASSYTGSRSTPTHDGGVVYHLGELGRLTAFTAGTGEVIWSLELREAFDAEIPEYGYAESVHIDGDRLYCTPAGKKGFLVCLDKKDGSLIWANTEIPGTVGFSSLILFEHGGHRQLAGLSSNCIFGVNADNGKLLWLKEFENSRSNNVPDPIFYNGYVFASSGYGKGSILLKLKESGKGIAAEQVWFSELMDNHHGGVILHEGYLYGAGHNARGWFCLDFMTGEQMWKTGGKGSLTYAEGRLYLLDERGIMTLAGATPDHYQAISTFEVPSGGKGMHWAHPVVCGGRLYIRHTDQLFAYDITPVD